MDGQYILEGNWTGCHGDRWRLVDGTITILDGNVVIESSGFKWRLMYCPDTEPLQRWRGREGQYGFEFIKGQWLDDSLSLKTHNVDDMTFLGFSTYVINLNFNDNSFTGKSETEAENPDRETPFTGDLDGKFAVRR